MKSAPSGKRLAAADEDARKAPEGPDVPHLRAHHPPRDLPRHRRTPATLTYDDGKGTTFTGRPGAFTIVITHQENNRLAGAIYGVVTEPDDRTIPIRSVQFSYATGL